jgi:hypothetical protein
MTRASQETCRCVVVPRPGGVYRAHARDGAPYGPAQSPAMDGNVHGPGEHTCEKSPLPLF